jgi:hypothetical protein
MKKDQKSKIISLRLDPKLYDKLERLAVENNQTISELIRLSLMFAVWPEVAANLDIVIKDLVQIVDERTEKDIFRVVDELSQAVDIISKEATDTLEKSRRIQEGIARIRLMATDELLKLQAEMHDQSSQASTELVVTTEPGGK